LEAIIYAFILAGGFAACRIVASAGPIAVLRGLLRALGMIGPSAGSDRIDQLLHAKLPMASFFAGGVVLSEFWRR
jgi:hypothetical protein